MKLIIIKDKEGRTKIDIMIYVRNTYVCNTRISWKLIDSKGSFNCFLLINYIREEGGRTPNREFIDR